MLLSARNKDSVIRLFMTSDLDVNALVMIGNFSHAEKTGLGYKVRCIIDTAGLAFSLIVHRWQNHSVSTWND